MAADSSSSAQRRRATKPLIEKRRRARINSSLAQLKEMIAKPNNNVQETRSNRLEKADILEMTVEYVRQIHSRKSLKDPPCSNTSDSSDPDQSFKEGYRLCMSEVQNFFSKNFKQQASKQYINHSLQNYLQQTFQNTLISTNSNSFQENTVLGEFIAETSTKCGCRNTTNVDKDSDISKKNDYIDVHSENSDFSYNYSSASTDDEMLENYSAPETETNKKLLLNDGVCQRQVSHYSRNGNTSSNDKMWRPW